MPRHTWQYTNQVYRLTVLGLFNDMEDKMKKILFINPPVVCVNECQKGWYSFAHPTSILKLIAWHRQLGHEVAFIDCMDYEVRESTPLQFYKKLPLGANNLNLFIDTFILGQSMNWLEQELQKQSPPDEVWVSCHMTFNSELTNQTTQTVRTVFPEAIILLGGNYPTLFPEHARQKSGAVINSGSIPEVNTLFPDYSLFTGPMDYVVFQLDLGCENNCSHCVNSKLLKEVVRFDVQTLVDDLKLKKELYGVGNFVNIDPNVAKYDLEDFLRVCVREKLEANLFFYGGIQPDKVTDKLAELMKEANVKGMTLPRELDNSANIRLHKSYGSKDFYEAISIFQKAGFNLSDFHCSFPVGFKDDCLIDIVSIIKEINDLGAIPEIAPVAFIPDTPEYDRHYSLLSGKTLEELNWALWPAIDTKEQIFTHAQVYNAAHGNKFEKPWDLRHCSSGR